MGNFLIEQEKLRNDHEILKNCDNVLGLLKVPLYAQGSSFNCDRRFKITYVNNHFEALSV